MQIWMNLVLVLQLGAAIVMIGLVLVQHGKGADMGASFGSGASGSLFGATGSANFLSRSTAVCAAVFFVSTLALAFMTNGISSPSPSSGGSVLDRASPPLNAPASAVSGAIPVAAPAPAISAVAPAPVASPAALAVPPAVPPAAVASAAPGAIPTK